MSKFKNTNATFWVIFKQCDFFFATPSSGQNFIYLFVKAFSRCCHPWLEMGLCPKWTFLILTNAGAKASMTSSLIAHPDKDKVCNLNVDPEASKILFATACQATKRLFGDLLRFKTSVYFCYKGRSTLVPIVHSVWKSQKKSHSTLRAKRATFTFWMDKS